MKKSILFLAAIAGLTTVSCQNFKKGDGGLEYQYLKEGSAEKASVGDVLAFNFVISTDRDSVLANSYDMGMPQAQPVMADSMLQNTYPGDANSILKMLGEGDSALFRINLDTMAARTGQPKPDFADKYIQYVIKVEKVFKKGDKADSVLFGEVNKYFEGEIEKLKSGEEAKIASYVKKNKLEPKKTASGLQYVVEKEGTGNKPSIGDTVVLNYTGSLATTGKIFDSSHSEIGKKENLKRPVFEPLRVSVGKDPVIQGWTEGLQLFNKGSKVKLIIPSTLGYGQQGQMGAIPPFAPLVFDIEILDIIAGAKEAPTAPDSVATPKATN